MPMRHGLAWLNECLGSRKVTACLLSHRITLDLPKMRQRSGNDFRSDGRTDREKDRKGGQAADLLFTAGPEIPVKHEIGFVLQTTFPKIHQQEGEIVENISGRDRIIELHGVEQRRLTLEKHDIAEMQVPVAPPHESASGRVR